MKKLVALGAALMMACASKREPGEEELRREGYVRDLAVQEHVQSAQAIASRPDVRFERGFSRIEYDPKIGGEGNARNSPFRAHAFRWMGERGSVRVRGHGDLPMKLFLSGWADISVLRTRPLISVYVDGQYLAHTVPVESGAFGIGVTVPREMVSGGGWVDLDIRPSSIGFHWGEPPELKVILIDRFEWSEAGG